MCKVSLLVKVQSMSLLNRKKLAFVICEKRNLFPPFKDKINIKNILLTSKPQKQRGSAVLVLPSQNRSTPPYLVS